MAHLPPSNKCGPAYGLTQSVFKDTPGSARLEGGKALLYMVPDNASGMRITVNRLHLD